MSDRARNNAHRTEKMIVTRSGRRTDRLALRLGHFVLPEDRGDSGVDVAIEVTAPQVHATPDEIAAYQATTTQSGKTTFGHLPGLAELRAKFQGGPQD